MTYNEDWLRENPLWTYDDAISLPADMFPSEWRSYWGIGDEFCPEHLHLEDWEAANEMHAVAQRVFSAVVALQSKGLPKQLRTLPAFLKEQAERERQGRRKFRELITSKLGPAAENDPEIRELLRTLMYEGESEAKAKLLHTAVEIEADRVYGLRPGLLAVRALRLLDFLTKVTGERSQQYLGRVSLCYIRAMDPELAVMSRGVMEAAMDDSAAIRDRVKANARIAGKGRPGLSARIQAAIDVKALDQSGREAAEFVKRAGDDAVHVVPQSVPNADSVMQKLVLVLDQLDRFARGSG